jgi:hypothetical protein
MAAYRKTRKTGKTSSARSTTRNVRITRSVVIGGASGGNGQSSTPGAGNPTTSTSSPTGSSPSANTTAGSGGTSATTTTNQLTPRTGLSAVALLHRLQQIADGVQKHKNDPGFPAFFAVNDIQVVHDEMALAVVTAAADKAQVKNLVLTSREQLAGARDMYQRGVLAVEATLGPANTQLVQFGLKPRKGAASSHAKQARVLRKRAKARAAKVAAAHSTSVGAATAPAVTAAGPGTKGAV